MVRCRWNEKALSPTSDETRYAQDSSRNETGGGTMATYKGNTRMPTASLPELPATLCPGRSVN
jgi:hypothetical protein